MGDIEEKVESLERLVLELDAMSSIFSNDFTNDEGAGEGDGEHFVVTTQEALQNARSIIECSPESFDIPRIDVEAVVLCSSDSFEGSTRLRMGLPKGYPSMCNAEVTVLSIPKNCTRSQMDDLSSKLQSISKELHGSEAMMEIMNECRDVMQDWESNKLTEPIPDEEQCSKDNNATDTICRKWIWVHHITNAGRLKQIVTEAQQLKLGGYLKGGYPGVVVVEGSATSCDEFVGWIKGNKSRPGGFGRNWGHHVRGEATVDARSMPQTFLELEDDMGKLGSLCKQFGVEDEFREFILQHK